MIDIFTTTDCPKCVKLVQFLDAGKIEYRKLVIDQDPEAETDALMLGIVAAPALRKGQVLLKTKDIFTKEGEISAKTMELVKK